MTCDDCGMDESLVDIAHCEECGSDICRGRAVDRQDGCACEYCGEYLQYPKEG